MAPLVDHLSLSIEGIIFERGIGSFQRRGNFHVAAGGVVALVQAISLEGGAEGRKEGGRFIRGVGADHSAQR